MNDDRLLWIARMIGLSGLGLLIFSGIGGVLLASRTAQSIKLFKGKTFTYHRTCSLIGAALLLLHPIPMLFAVKTTGGLNLLHVFVPFIAPKQNIWIGIGVLAAYSLVVVTITSLYIKKMKRTTWRLLHYGTYLVLFLGLAHGLFISAEFREGEGLFSGEKKLEQPGISEERQREQAAEKKQEEPSMSEEQKREQADERKREQAGESSDKEKKREGSIIDLEEPEKIILLIMAGITILFPIWRIIAARKNRSADTTIVCLLLLCLAAGTTHAQEPAKPYAKQQAQDNLKELPVNQDAPKQQARHFLPDNLTGTYVTTFNVSTIGRPAPSINQRLNLDYALPKGRIIDLRLEYYNDGSFNGDPPGRLIRNINEPKIEIQLTYTHPITNRFSLSGAILHHENFRFSDTYWWAIMTGTYTAVLTKSLTLTANISGEQRLAGGRPFVDFSGALDYNFGRNWTLEANLHEYENYGAFDPSPTHKQEYEFAIIRQLRHKQFIGLSFFRHIQVDAPNDQFSFIKLKYGISF